jgi:hypothetical protein
MRKLPSRATTLALALAVATTTACGALFNGSRQTITATSAPDGATIQTNPGGSQYTTPASLNLERKNDYVLTFSREGYRPATFTINKSVQGGIVVLDVLFTGLIGVIIDAATGSWYKLSPEAATVALTRVEADAGPEIIEVRVSEAGEGFHIDSDVPGVAVTVDPKP